MADLGISDLSGAVLLQFSPDYVAIPVGDAGLAASSMETDLPKTSSSLV